MSDENKRQDNWAEELEADQKEALFQLFKAHNGSCMSAAKDPLSPWRDRSRIAFYAKKYDFKTRLEKERVEDLKRIADERNKMLNDAKTAAIERAINMIDSKGLEAGDLKKLWEIIKTELGETTRIVDNNNVNKNDPEVQETLDELRKLIQGDGKQEIDPRDNAEVVQGKGETTGDTAQV